MAAFPRTHKQETPSDTWTFVHNMGVNPVTSVKVLENGVLTEILPSSIEYPDGTTVIIKFTSPRQGEARLA